MICMKTHYECNDFNHVTIEELMVDAQNKAARGRHRVAAGGINIIRLRGGMPIMF
jgi:hypothetical protein